MKSSDRPMKGMGARDIARIGLLSSAAVILFVLEGLAPRPLPWMKLGLGNLPVLVALLIHGAGAAFGVSGVKLLLGGLLSGSLGGPAFVIGAGAGWASLLVMAVVRRVAGGMFSPIGLSILGASTHQMAQLFIAQRYVGHIGLLSLLPLSLLSGFLSGGLIGLLAFWICEKMDLKDRRI
jgi:heptaprenyl diphosphate synthase